MEKGFRGEHFEHISVFKGERAILSGIPGFRPDSEGSGAGKGIISRISGKGWEGMCTAVASQRAWWLNRIEAILNDLSGKQWNWNNGKSS